MSSISLAERSVNVPDFEHMGQAGKLCSRCKQWKPRDGFNRRTVASDGLQSWCKRCMAVAAGRSPITPVKPLGSRGVSIRAGWGVSAPAPAAPAPAPVVAAPAPVAVEVAAPAREEVPVELVEAARSTLGKLTLGEYLTLEEAPSVWIGPGGVSVMASPGAGGVEYAVLTPHGDAPGFRTDRDAAHYIAGLLADKHAARPGVALEGVMVYGGGKRS
jgi:hypothetical protein